MEGLFHSAMPVDMDRINALGRTPINDAGRLPVRFVLGGREVCGIPASFTPKTSRRLVDANLIEIVHEGIDPDTGLCVRAECTAYLDHPVVEWVVSFQNTSAQNTPVLSDIRACDMEFACSSAKVLHGNGDLAAEAGFQTFETDLADAGALTIAPRGGKPCFGAFPYIRVMCGGWGLNLAIGWPGQWQADFRKTDAGFQVSAGQQYTNFYLKPGELARTPRITLQCFEGDEARGINLWRRWYMAHILPRTGGGAIGPKLCTHVMGGGEEFTLATEHNQLDGIDTYFARGLDFDVWWIDAGWYPCRGEDGVKHWPNTGDWRIDADNFPRGLSPVGEACKKHGAQLLLWFEPERARRSHLSKDVPNGYYLTRKLPDGKIDETLLLNFGDPAARAWMTGLVDDMIKQNHIGVYRQDFNMFPLEWWLQNDAEDRKGITENLHVQGYLQYWDDLLMNNPGLWIDSCASGGMRNDLETMRRAVTLQFTDYALAEPVIKESFNYTMFQWIPYFRNHTMAHDDEDGNYNAGKPAAHGIDNYAYQAAMAPSITCMVDPYDQTEQFEYCKRMNPIWRAAAEVMLKGDYYPLMPYSKAKESFYSVQFHMEEEGRGILQGIRNLKCPQESVTVWPRRFDPGATYRFESPEFGKRVELSGRDLCERGFEFALPIRSGEVWFYRKL